MGTQPEIEYIEIDLDDISIDEIDMIEEIADMPFTEFGVQGVKQGPLMRALATVIKRRTDPTFTPEQAGRIRLNLAVAADPTGPAAAAG